jgi:hypothetical protein
MRLKTLCLLSVLLLLSCDKPRDIERVLPAPSRIAKTTLEGSFLFLKSVVEVKSPSAEFEHYASGQYLENDKLVQFVQREDQVDIVSIDPLYTVETAAPLNRILASFPAEHVDIVRKKNGLGDETHEEEESQSRREWNQRSFVTLSLTDDLADSHSKLQLKAALLKPLQIDPSRGSLSFIVERLFADGTSLSIHYSFLRYKPSSSYLQREYSETDQLQFGLFKTTSFQLDVFDQFSDSKKKEFMNRWDTSRTITYFFSKDFPETLKPGIREVFRRWSEALRSAVGDSVLELRDNTGEQVPGDLRYNLILYDDSEHSSHGILGYAPIFTNPRTGEILKADVILYGKVLKRALFQEVYWEQNRSNPAQIGQNAFESGIALRESTLADLSKQVTRIDERTLQNLLLPPESTTDLPTLEQRILTSVFAHEFGHCLGLRHNFLGSADAAHFDEGARTSSIMDYSFLQGHEWTVGQYDRAAISYAYSPIATKREKALRENYLYCSDADVYSSRNPLCLPHDTGKNLIELISGQIDRYFSHYEVNNKRLERIDFGAENDRYTKRILATLLPIRLAYDNASALVSAHARNDFVTVWKLAKQRVESSDPSEREQAPEDFLPIEIPKEGGFFRTGSAPSDSTSQSLTRVIDLGKLRAVVDDARIAKQDAVTALKRIVFDASRPDYDRFDPVFQQKEIRGVLQDKLLALTLTVAPTPHPILSGRVLSPYSVAERTVPNLLASLLSNTSEVKDPEGSTEPYYRIRQFDISLRQHALKLLKEEVAILGRHPDARELIRVQPTTIESLLKDQPADYQENLTSRDEFREFYRTLLLEEVSRGYLDPETGADISLADLSPFEQSRNRFEFAYTTIAPREALVAPMTLPTHGIKTASGLLIRNNLNVAEDHFLAISFTKDQIEQDVLSGRPALIGLRMLAELEAKQSSLQRYITGEQLFLQEMYKAFTGED